MKSMVALCVCATFTLALMADVQGAEKPKNNEKETAAGRYLKLGTSEGSLGGEQQKAFELQQLKDQIKTFIPPLLRPAFTQHAFVLPPGLFSISATQRFASLDGDDFFRDGEVDPVFRARSVDRHFTDIDLFYGFDLGRKYLHGFTARINVPYLNSELKGSVFPVPGAPFPNPENIASTQEFGDIGLFLKKKVLDQGNNPVGLAVVGGVYLPTGDNNERFGSDGRINVKVPPGLGGNVNMVFTRFSDDGRLPSVVQPGTGTFSYLLGGFLTRQFSHGSFPGRSAAHFGITHRFVFEDDGIDFGDKTLFFASFVKPFYRDYLAADLTFLGIDKDDDSYAGLFAKPGTGLGPGNPVVMVPRPAFSGGFTGFIAPSLIFSPDPQIRMTLSGLFRIIEPDLGPAPPWVFRASLEVTF